MNKTEFLKSHVSNLDKVLEHSDKLFEPHQSLVNMTKRLVDTYTSMTAREQKALGLVYRKSMLSLVERSIKKIERLEEHNVQMKAKSLSLKMLDLETLFLQ